MNFLSGVMLNNDLLQQLKEIFLMNQQKSKKLRLNFLWTFFFRLNQNLFCF